MTVLKAIGRFFARIGRWIKDTAWVQPLLIVGGIFAIIFSIKPLSDWFGSMFQGGVASEDYYNQFKLSLEGAEDGKSDADKLISYMEKSGTEGNYPSKFYLAFVSKGCDNCDACYPGFKLLQENFDKDSAFKIDSDKKGEGFKIYTIYCDQRNSDDELLIDDLLRNHKNYFQELFGQLNEEVDTEDYYYYVNTKDKSTFKTNVKSFFDCIDADEDEENVSIPTPTTILFDKTDFGQTESMYKCVSQVFFNYTVDVDNASDNFNKAYFLRDSWNYAGNYTKK